jgi:hypothetical protein
MLRYTEKPYSMSHIRMFQPYWNWLVSKLPLWLAPNLITIIGLLVNISTSLILMYYNPDAKGTNDPPRWTYLLCGVGLFIYQSLDAIGENRLS